MTTIEIIPRRRASPELREAYDEGLELWGASTAPPVAMQIVQCFSQRPGWVRNVALGYHYVGWCGTLPRTQRETLAVLISRFNDCFY